MFLDEIKDYYVIGDLHSAALVSKNASIDWLCLPHFDSSSIFARILDKDGGSLSMDTDGYSVSSRYIKNSAVVEFNFKNAQSEFFLRDFMVPQPNETCENHFLVRKFVGKKGVSHVSLLFNPKPEYARSAEKLKLEHDLDLEIPVGEDAILFYPPENATVEEKDGMYHIRFDLSEGQETSLVVEYTVKNERPKYKDQDLEPQTLQFWQRWVAKGQYFDFHKDEIIRSAITLKLMQFYPTGAIIAAPTTSLPEAIGGSRNWDYRYVWMRDATFTLYAFYVLGYTEEATKFFTFVQKIVEECSHDDFDVALMYTIEGKEVPKEKTLPHFSGYKNSKPVRIGNGAADQFQLDVYGSLIDAYYFLSKRGMQIDKKHQKLILNLLRKIQDAWKKKDHGIWEVRSGQQHFTYSKVMCWVGVNRTLRMKDILGLTTHQVIEFQKLEKEIHDWIWQNCYDPVKQTFTQYPASNHQDATNLLFVLLQFLDKHDPRTRTIIENTCLELSRNEVYVYRYFSDDGLKGDEGAFLLCTFWLISSWAIIEDTDKAQSVLSKIEQQITKSGLLSEEVDPNTKEYLGNFPQAFSHIGYIMSAYYLHKYTARKKRE